MSDPEDGDVSDPELDDEFDDFDPLLVEEGKEEEREASAESEDEDEGAAEAELPEEGAPRKSPRKPEARVDRQAQASTESRRLIVVPPEERLTSNAMTLAEAARAIAIRAQQIATYPNVYTDIGGLTDPKDIAQKELLDRRSPLCLRRAVGRTPANETIVEEWSVREMSYPSLN